MNKINVTIGFDGYIDAISHPIEKNGQYFSNMEDFASYIKCKAPSSFAIQMDEVSRRMGGNAPLLARSLRSYGIQSRLIGMLGENAIDEIFNEVNTADTYTYMESALTQALEFSNGKIFLSNRIPESRNALDKIVSIIGEQNAYDSFSSADLLVMVNWGELDFMHSLWTDISNRYILNTTTDKTKKIFIDTADISRHPNQRIKELITLIQKLSNKRTVILGLNRNESKMLSNTLNCSPEICDLFLNLKIDELLIHTSESSCAINHTEKAEVKVRKIDRPILSTGAGDNFNAGYCYALIKKYPLKERLEIANASSHFYMSSGYPANEIQLLQRKKTLYNK